MFRSALSDLFRLSHCKNSDLLLSKCSVLNFLPPSKVAPYRNYTQLFRHKCNNVKSSWNTISIRNKTKRSRKHMLAQRFYKNVHQGFAIIAVSTLLFLKMIGTKLLLLQLAPIIFMLRRQLPIIGQTFTRDVK